MTREFLFLLLSDRIAKERLARGFCLLSTFGPYKKLTTLVDYFGKTSLDMGAIPINSTENNFSSFVSCISFTRKKKLLKKQASEAMEAKS